MSGCGVCGTENGCKCGPSFAAQVRGEIKDRDAERGLYKKYKIERTDGSSEPGRKHYNCWYYVLDVRHDKHAVAALKAYIESCRTEFPALAADLEKAIEHRDCTGSPFFDGHQHKDSDESSEKS